MNRLLRTSALLALGLAALPSAVQAQYAPTKGSLGGSLGAPFLYSTSELRAGQKPRLMGKAHFQYVFSPEWRLSLRGGFGWLGHGDTELAPFLMPSNAPGTYDSTRVDQLDTFMPVTAALVRTWDLSDEGSWKLFGGGGLGVYRVDLMNDRRTIYHPETFKRYRFVSPGINGELGAEYFLSANRNVSFECLGTIHYLFEANGSRYPAPNPVAYYPSGKAIRSYNGRYGFFDLSFGVNVYFRTRLGAETEPVFPEETPAEPGEEPGKEPGEPGAPESPPAPPPTPETP